MHMWVRKVLDSARFSIKFSEEQNFNLRGCLGNSLNVYVASMYLLEV